MPLGYAKTVVKYCGRNLRCKKNVYGLKCVNVFKVGQIHHVVLLAISILFVFFRINQGEDAFVDGSGVSGEYR